MTAPAVGQAIAPPSATMARVAFASSYPPRTCGVATFTDHLARVSADREIVALDLPGQRPAYAMEVHHRIRVDERGEFARVAASLSSCVDVVSIQYAPSLWGEDDGEALLDFLGALTIPSVTTLHEIPSDPTPRERAVLLAVIQGSTVCVALSESGRTLLAEGYGVDPVGVDVIPHGVPDLPAAGPEAATDAAALLGVAGRDVVLSFGLLGPEKGCELTIDAMPAILAAHPQARHVIVGATHPDEVARDGEAFRTALAARANALRLGDAVQFVDRFVGRTELTRWLQAASVVVMPHRDGGRVASPSLAYAVGVGRPVVSAPNPYAVELLADGAGVVLSERTPAALAAAVIELLDEPDRRGALSAAAHERARPMVWSRVGPAYRSLFDRVAAGGAVRETRRSPRPRRPIQALRR